MSRTKSIIRGGSNAQGVSRQVNNAREGQDQNRKWQRIIKQSETTVQQMTEPSRQ